MVVLAWLLYWLREFKGFHGVRMRPGCNSLATPILRCRASIRASLVRENGNCLPVGEPCQRPQSAGLRNNTLDYLEKKIVRKSLPALESPVCIFIKGNRLLYAAVHACMKRFLKLFGWGFRALLSPSQTATFFDISRFCRSGRPRRRPRLRVGRWRRLPRWWWLSPRPVRARSPWIGRGWRSFFPDGGRCGGIRRQGSSRH